MMRFVFLLLCLGSVTTLATASPAQEITPKVVDVLDGDTITVLHEGVKKIVRLNAIDCPERNQPYGMDAKKPTTSRVMHTVVSIQAKDLDRDGRMVADVILAVTTSLNCELVKEGLAWWFFRYSSDVAIKTLEKEARDGKRGLWQDPIPIPPWVFRKIQRKQVPDLADFEYPGTQPSGVLANKRSHVYPARSCKGYVAMAEHQNVMTFGTAEEPEAAGYHQASHCSRKTAQE